MRKITAKIMLIALLISACFMKMDFQANAANKDATGSAKAVVITTNRECTIWSAPATSDSYRVRKVPAGYKITVYPEIVNSDISDSKTFYRTIKGSYILTKCCSFEGAAVLGERRGKVENTSVTDTNQSGRRATYANGLEVRGYMDAHALLDLVNADRAAKGSAPLVWDDELYREALARIDTVYYNYINGIYAHEGKKDTYAENCAYAYGHTEYTPGQVNRAWIGSRGHHENRTTDYYTKYAAVGFVDGDGRYVYVELFRY